MVSDKENSISFAEASSDRYLSPPPSGFRHRPLGRASTFAEPNLNRRRSSIFSSETLSDARKSIRSSTDDILLPRAIQQDKHRSDDEDSHWQSAGVGLALLPAVGSMFFKGGGDFITDVILLLLAAIFMHWSLRVPWEWYHSAQAIAAVDPRTSSPSTPVVEEEGEDDDEGAAQIQALDQNRSTSPVPVASFTDKTVGGDQTSAEAELRLHELAALCCCFICPGLSALLLHAIRAHLSRPSEGLVSNFNIAIFLMFAEIKPMSHLIKLILRRTLFLQRRVNLESLQSPSQPTGEKLNDLVARIEEIEAHVANGIVARDSQPSQTLDQAAATASALAVTEVRKLMQPEIEALARAMRRYEKKSTISAVQIEGRLQQLETRCADVVVLAASAQRSVQSQPRQYYLVVVNWVCGAIVIPVEMAQSMLLLPRRVYQQMIAFLARLIPGLGREKRSKDNKSQRRSGKLQTDKRAKTSS